ncbi:hypothetical protein ACFV19_25575 [Streptomyces griseoluteus]|uniref:hypothetical protein n=1 Tax=Streptomyces griseoluteus TaxID=29306 RepID=UPI003693D8F0
MNYTAPMLSRRQILGIGAGMAAGSALAALPSTAIAAPAGGEWKGRRSQNGWSVIGSDQARTFRIEGTDVDATLRDGDVATVLLYVARRFSYEIDMLRSGDVEGHATDRHVGAEFESNHLSGTALAVRPLWYPLGASQGTGMSTAERTVIADVLADCSGVVAWGGDLNPVKESHFHIDVSPSDARLKELARRIQGWNDTPGRGAGTIDAFSPARIEWARKAAPSR